MAKLITVFWRDIPSQVVAKRGRESARAKLSHRFQVAIDRAAMRAGKGGSEPYLAEWRRVPRKCGADLTGEVEAEAERLEALYPDDLLERMVKAHGLQVQD